MNRVKLDNGTIVGIIVTLVSSACSIVIKKYAFEFAIVSLVIAAGLIIYLYTRKNEEGTNSGLDSEYIGGTANTQKEAHPLRMTPTGWVILLLIIVSIAFSIFVIVNSFNSGNEVGGSIFESTTSVAIVDPTPVKVNPTPVIEIAETSGIEISTRPYQGRIAAGYNFTVALRDDGSVVCVGGDGDIYVENWEGIKQIAAYGYHVLGLFENGKVAFTGKSASGEKEVTSWSGIKQVAACYEGSIGLKEDGTVVYAGFDKNNLSECQSWSGIKRILGGEDHIVGLTNSGNIVTSGYNGGGSGDGRRQDFSFSNVIEGFAASGTTFCVFSDNSVAAYGTDWAGEDMIGGWSNIVAICGGDKHTVGLKKDGSVVAMGSNEFGQCNVKGWTDIIAIYCGQFHTVGLKSDGTLVATGLNTSGQCDVDGIDLW